ISAIQGRGVVRLNFRMLPDLTPYHVNRATLSPGWATKATTWFISILSERNVVKSLFEGPTGIPLPSNRWAQTATGPLGKPGSSRAIKIPVTPWEVWLKATLEMKRRLLVAGGFSALKEGPDGFASAVICCPITFTSSVK